IRVPTAARPTGPADPAVLTAEDETGPAVAAPLRTRRRTWGVVTVARPPGEREFTEVEREVLSDLASQ
ncbi:GAF domain-containing protein, partial [Vibrio parahaemolyticus]